MQIIGRVQIIGQGAATGNVLTSDAAGNATWQSQQVSIRIQDMAANLAVASNTITPVTTQWSVVATEEGGANFNPVTGGYTITKAGSFQSVVPRSESTHERMRTVSAKILILAEGDRRTPSLSPNAF